MLAHFPGCLRPPAPRGTRELVSWGNEPFRSTPRFPGYLPGARKTEACDPLGGGLVAMDTFYLSARILLPGLPRTGPGSAGQSPRLRCGPCHPRGGRPHGTERRPAWQSQSREPEGLSVSTSVTAPCSPYHVGGGCRWKPRCSCRLWPVTTAHIWGTPLGAKY